MISAVFASFLHGRIRRAQQLMFLNASFVHFHRTHTRMPFFHIKNYTPLSKVCQPFAQIPAVKFCIFVALPSFTLVVLCNSTTFSVLRTFSVSFCIFADSPPDFHSTFTQICHTAFAILTSFSDGCRIRFIHYSHIS